MFPDAIPMTIDKGTKGPSDPVLYVHEDFITLGEEKIIYSILKGIELVDRFPKMSVSIGFLDTESSALFFKEKSLKTHFFKVKYLKAKISKVLIKKFF